MSSSIEVTVDSSAEADVHTTGFWTEMVAVLEGGSEGTVRLGIDGPPSILLTNGVPLRFTLEPNTKITAATDQASAVKIHFAFTELSYLAEHKRMADLMSLLLQVLAPGVKAVKAHKVSQDDLDAIEGKLPRRTLVLKATSNGRTR